MALDVSRTQVERLAGSRAHESAPITGVGVVEDLARIAERGLIDLIFFGDCSAAAAFGRRVRTNAA
jgi:hypothetical protein